MREAEKQGNFPEAPIFALARYATRFAARDWFKEQIGHPKLRELRGLREGEPLPRHLGLLDAAGMPLESHSRTAWQKLAKWLDDDEAILAFTFPEGLPAEVDVLRKDLELLRNQSWSPLRGARAILDPKDWPKRERERPYTLEAADAELYAVCEKALEDFKKK